ncbi:hypothetical protein CRENBAI_007148 [Crenichthys baileyi]|uniref:Uncharacterized protein n=1 Tax=Crenichthys baileyi TaxID=28760 RepID=A0AAV9RSB9_9TELE
MVTGQEAVHKLQKVSSIKCRVVTGVKDGMSWLNASLHLIYVRNVEKEVTLGEPAGLNGDFMRQKRAKRARTVSNASVANGEGCFCFKDESDTEDSNDVNMIYTRGVQL